jgi:hypothetical protein
MCPGSGLLVSGHAPSRARSIHFAVSVSKSESSVSFDKLEYPEWASEYSQKYLLYLLNQAHHHALEEHCGGSSKFWSPEEVDSESDSDNKDVAGTVVPKLVKLPFDPFATTSYAPDRIIDWYKPEYPSKYVAPFPNSWRIIFKFFKAAITHRRMFELSITPAPRFVRYVAPAADEAGSKRKRQRSAAPKKRRDAAKVWGADTDTAE